VQEGRPTLCMRVCASSRASAHMRLMRDVDESGAAKVERMESPSTCKG
jgi:hypothetical protein